MILGSFFFQNLKKLIFFLYKIEEKKFVVKFRKQDNPGSGSGSGPTKCIADNPDPRN